MSQNIYLTFDGNCREAFDSTSLYSVVTSSFAGHLVTGRRRWVLRAQIGIKLCMSRCQSVRQRPWVAIPRGNRLDR